MRKKIYLLGIGGIAMANLACLLKKRGFDIYGSDIDTFGPSAELLKKSKIKYFKDHDPDHIKKFRPNTVVIGNAIKRGNPALEYILAENIPYRSMPETIKEEVIKKNKSIVITGTSGKTTTTALTAWILNKAGLKPSALIGGISRNFDSGFLNGSGHYVVVEGDEYNSSFNDSSPKFVHYSPFIAVVNNIQPDHLDIHGSLEGVIEAFQKIPPLIPKNGLLIFNANNENSISLKKMAKSRVEAFGQGGSVFAKKIKTNTDGIEFDLYRKKKLGKIKTNLLGLHNVENILAASTVALNIGISFKKLSESIKTFKGVKRRLEIIYNKKNIEIIDDFAHNPDKVSASLSALRSHFPQHKIIAIFEPRTGSSRRKFFQDIYPNSFDLVDTAYIAEPFKKEVLKADEVFSSQKLANDLNKKGIESYAFASADDIVAHLKDQIFNKSLSQPILIIIMTSGEFGGIHQKLIKIAGNSLAS